jgi:hypothetical protein
MKYLRQTLLSHINDVVGKWSKSCLWRASRKKKFHSFMQHLFNSSSVINWRKSSVSKRDIVRKFVCNRCMINYFHPSINFQPSFKVCKWDLFWLFCPSLVCSFVRVFWKKESDGNFLRKHYIQSWRRLKLNWKFCMKRQVENQLFERSNQRSNKHDPTLPILLLLVPTS